MIIGDMEIRLRADIARLQRDMDDARRVVGNTMAGVERAANAAKAALGGIVSGLGGRELIQMTDEYTKFTAQLKLATQSQREYAAAYADVKRISTQSTQGLGETGVLYARIANGTRELGVAQKQVAAITETVNLSLMVSGATASEAASAQLQLSQAFASGTLRGEEFNAVNEAAPRLMKALADGIGVPVGALKKMAEEGQITSGIMADVLPNALGKLREEAKEVQTIGGAFTVLKNNAMEFVGVQAQANGVVAAAAGGLTLLANNLSLVAGSVMTLGAAKLGSVIGEWVASTYRQITAATALRAANIASAEAEVAATGAKLAQMNSTQAMIVVAREEAMAKLVSSNANISTARSAIAAAEAAGAQSFALRTLRLATAELGAAEAQRAAMMAELAILGRQQAAVSAQITAATTAQAAAQAGLNAATTAGIGAAGLASRALGFLGGPIGAIITVLGIGAMAWSQWGNSAKEANDKAAQSIEETHDEVISRIQKQVDKLKERAALANAQPNLKVENAADLDRLAKLWTEYNDAKNGTGKFANATLEYRGVMERIALREHGELLKNLTSLQAAQTAAAQKGVDARVTAFMKENATRQEQMAAEIKSIEDLKGKTGEYDEMVRRIREKYADKGAAAAIKQEATAYQNLMTSIREKVAANQLELSGYEKLSESQKATIKLDAEISTGKSKLSADSIKQARAEIERLEVQEQALESQKLRAKATEAETKADADRYDKLRAGTSAVEERIVQMQREVEMHGLTAAAAVDAEKAKLEAKLALGPATHAELIALDQQIEKLGQLADLVRQKETLDASKEAADQVIEDQKRLWSDIERTAHDTFISIFDSGKSAFDRLKDALKNGLYELLYQMTVKKWIINLQTSSTGNSLAQAITSSGSGGSSIFGSASNLFSVGKSIFSGFSSGMGGAIAQFGNTFGSQAISAFGNGMSGSAAYASQAMGAPMTGAASAGSSAASALPVVGWIAAGMAAANSLYKQGWNAQNGSLTDSLGGKAIMPFNAPMLHLNTALQKIGLSDSLANMLSGASTVSKLFGRKNPEIESQGIQGSISASGFDGNAYANILEKGGIFRSDKRYTQTAALGADQDKSLDATVKAMIDAAKGFASTLGIEASVIDGYNKQIKLQLGADEAKNQEAIAKLFGEIGDELSLRLVPNLASFALAGEATSATLQRLVTDYATVDEALTAIGMQFGAVGVASLSARERLIEAAGGLEAFAANTAGFQQNFLSEAERNAPALKAVTEQLAALGLAGVDTRDEFKQVVLGLDLASEAGAKQYGALMKMQEAFAQVYPAIDKAAIAAAELAKAEERANQVRDERRGLQDELDQLTMSEVQLLEKRRAVLDESNRPLFDHIEALKAQAAAQRAATQAAKDRGADLLSGLDSAFSALQSVVGREKALLQESATAHRNLASALHGALDGMTVSGFEREDRLGAQAEVRAALAIAKASGVLPDVDSIKGALSVLGKDSSAMFATQTDYLRDFYATQNDIADLAGVADQRLSAEEQAIERLDGILASAQQQIDALKGIDTSIFSLAEAISGFDRAVAAVKADPVASAGGELQKLYKDLLGRQIDSTGLKFYSDRMAEGTTLAEIRAAIKQSEEYKKLKGIPGFANGGDFGGGMRLVGEVGPELEVTGPSRIHSTRDLMASLRNPSDNSAALAAAVERLTATTESQARIIQGLEAAMDQTERNTKRVADGLERLSGGWDKLRTEEQTA